MKVLLSIILIGLAVAAGGAGGYALRPSADTSDHPTDDVHDRKDTDAHGTDLNARAYVKINNQFVVPVIKNDAVVSLVVLSVSLETDPSSTDILYNHEPKIRDAFISILFDYAYADGFGADFTSSPNLNRLRVALLESAHNVVPDVVSDVLITDIVRQDS